jgi:hypothetical protein
MNEYIIVQSATLLQPQLQACNCAVLIDTLLLLYGTVLLYSSYTTMHKLSFLWKRKISALATTHS